MRVLVGVLIAAVLFLTAAVLWVGAEMHYDNCVSDANGRHPVVVERRRGNPVDVNERRRERAIDDCSRSPL